jgi:hypothetical protein
VILGVKILVDQFRDGRIHRPSTFLLLMSLKQKGIKLVAAGTVQFPFLQLGGKVENFLVDEMSTGVLKQRPKKKNDVNNLPERLHVPERLHEQRLHELVNNMMNLLILGGKTPRRGRHLNLHGLPICTIVVPPLPRKVRIINLMFTRQRHLLQLLYRRFRSLLPLLQRLLNRLLTPAMLQKFYLEAMAKEFFRKNLQGPSGETLQNILIQRPISM